MRPFGLTQIFVLSVLFYLAASVLSLILAKKQKLCVLLSNTACIFAAALGITFSLVFLLSNSGAITIDLFRSQIPYLDFNIRIDSLSAFFILGLSVVTACVSLYSIGYLKHYNGKRSMGLMNFLYPAFILTMILVYTSGNAFFFLFAWEAMSAISYFLVVFESEKEENRKAGTLYIIMTSIGTCFLLAAFMIQYSYTHTFDLSAGAAVPSSVKDVLFILFLLGFGTKAGVIPLHIWLPAAHPAAPSNVSALMSGVMIKTAIYGILRFIFENLGVQNTWWGVALLVVGVISAVLGVAYAMIEHNIKRLLAFHSIENIGIILIGAGAAFIAFAQKNTLVGSLALTASLLHTFNHTLFKSGLFLGAGSIQYATHTKDIEKLGGLIKKMPATALLMLCFSIAISALVPFNGFVSEWLTFQSLFAGISPGQSGLNILSIISVAALALSGALAAACFAKLFGISFLGKPRTIDAANAREVPMTMRLGMGVLAALCLAVGLFPMALIKLTDNVVTGLGGVSLVSQMQGGFAVAYYPLQVKGNSISTAGLLAALAGIVLILLIVLRVAGGKYIQRKYGTWDCGYEALTARMQYTATGFSKPIKIVFRILFRPSRELKISGELPYHPEKMEYTVASESIIDKHVYEPVTNFFKNLSRKTKYSVQTGSIRRYLAYIFFVLVFLMLISLFV
jgi:formate hydrogenlyase subunit 3/multisubunit Na+/H+ antiporter MnhD subunit